MVVPMFVYLAMNILSFVALQRIDAGLFTILAQVGIISLFLCPPPSPLAPHDNIRICLIACLELCH